MKSDWIEKDEKCVWHPFTPSTKLGPSSHIMERAKGSFVFDSDGKRYFDSTSSWWCNLHGHCHPRLVRALSSQAETMDQVLFAPHSHKPGIELAAKLTKLLGDPMSRVFYSDDGSTAVETAIKMAIQYWKNVGQSDRKFFISLDRAYHGDTLGSVAMGSVAEYHQVFNVFSQISFKSTAPYCYRCPKGLKYPTCKIACLDEAKKIISEKGSSIAALVIEPLLLGAGGMILYPVDYVEELARLCREAGILLIYDEVLTGFGRLGTMFASEQIKQKPDIVCLSKGITSGMLPLGATVTSERIYEAFHADGDSSKAFYHGHTFTGNPLSISVALESLKIFEEDRVLERNRGLIEIMSKEALRFRELRLVGDVRHHGMVWAAELVLDKNQKTPPTPPNSLGWKIAERMWKLGFWVRPLANIVYVIPPYSTGTHDLNNFFSALYTEVERLGGEL
jgi:adenosylmethionine---8-amino-7-oxononanoate aminotransferase